MKPSEKLSEELHWVKDELDKANRKIGVYYNPKKLKQLEKYLKDLEQSIQILQQNNL